MLTALLGFGLAAPAHAEDVFPWSSEDQVTDDDLSRLDCDQLWHARNEIYARNGKRFQTARARAVFGNDGWVDNPRLTPLEQRNVASIQGFERRYCQ